MAEQDNRLVLLRELSRSGIAAVWEAYDPTLDRKVLLKSINPQYARESDLRVRFEREARAIARLSHPNVVRIYDLRAEPDDLSLVLEFIEGNNLGRLLKERGQLPAEVAATIAGDILAGLEHAHAAGIVHRDLKPDNVLVSTEGEVKITDFGLATLQDQPTLTQEGMVIGTPSYMAPEQAEGGEIGAVTDEFAAGLILFEMLTGRRLHEGSTLAETFQNVLRYQPPRLEAFREVIPPEIEPVLRRMLERQPGRRYGSAGEARQALEQALADGFLPRALMADFLSGEPLRRPAARGTARSPRWTHLLRNGTLAALAIVGAALIYHFAELSRVPVEPSAEAPADSSAGSGPAVGPASNEPDSTGSVVARVEEPKPIPIPPPDTPVERPAGDTARTVPQDTAAAVASMEPGRLTISCRPWASVYLADSLIGNTPLAAPLRLPPGSYNLVLLNPEIGHPISRTVTVEPGQSSELRINLYDYVARIRIAAVKPWADVYVNGVFECRTPTSKVIYRPLGTYTVTLKNPEFPDYSETLVFQEADSVREVRVDLTQR